MGFNQNFKMLQTILVSAKSVTDYNPIGGLRIAAHILVAVVMITLIRFYSPKKILTYQVV